jgi:GR25 family glycosyltransferase involved in LPS biosynthesis
MELLQHVLYINIDHRTDRLEHVIAELQKIGVANAERFPAIYMNVKNVCCTISHICCIELAKTRNWPHVFICEDDITFTNPQVFCNSLKQFVESTISWDVLVIGGNNDHPFIQINDFCAKVMNIQTTTGYIVKKEYYNVLLDNFKKGLELLIQNPMQKIQFSIDIYWKRLQQRDQWYVLLPLTVIQYSDYSDIENRKVDYSKAMLTLK